MAHPYSEVCPRCIEKRDRFRRIDRLGVFLLGVALLVGGYLFLVGLFS